MENAENKKDPILWELAKRRVGFKKHLATYIGMSAFFWILWFFTGWRYSHIGTPWPVWPMMGWGIGLMFHFLSVYVFESSNNVENEYEKLRSGRSH